MSISEEDLARIEAISNEILGALESVATSAQGALRPPGADPTSVLADPGARGAAEAARRVQYSRDESRRHVERVLREPFVNRIRLRWENETDETLYVTRGSAAGLKAGVKLASQASAYGRLGELNPGESGTLPTKQGLQEYEILERVDVRPVRAEQWDAIDDRFLLGRLRAALESLRKFLESRGAAPAEETPEEEDILAILRAAEEGAETVRETLKRRVIEHMSLRDQPTLDRYQGEISRLSLDRQVLLLGPPGSGKTTTLIRRLGHKRHPEGLSEDEREVLEVTGLSEPFRRSAGWVMFSPTDLLQLYLHRAFNREEVAAEPGKNLRTWDRERRDLARNVLGILRTQADGPGFALDESAAIVKSEGSGDVAALHDAFLPFAHALVVARVSEAFDVLESADDSGVVGAVGALHAQLGAATQVSVREIGLLVDLAPTLQPEITRLKQETEASLSKMVGQVLGRRNPELMAELVAALPGLRGNVGSDDDEDDEDDEEDVQLSTRNPQREAAELLLAGLRARARQLATGKRKPSARVGRLLDLLGTRVPPEEELTGVGARLVLMREMRMIVRAPRRLVMGMPTLYGRFRRSESKWFRDDAAEAIRQRRISSAEVDVLILAMMSTARRLFDLDRRRYTAAVPDWLDGIRQRYVPQVFVDEATDFSSVQLACILEIAHPRLRSWFACGDFRQRITSSGIQVIDELGWVAETVGLDGSIDHRDVSVGYRQSPRLRALAAALEGSRVESGAPSASDGLDHGPDIWPLLLEGQNGEGLAAWIAARIADIGRTVRPLPSIAIFVESEAAIDPLVSALAPKLAEQNMPVVACREGRDIGDRQEIRVFDIQHIKGLEFEAVFFVGVDALAERMPELFDRFVYVGLTRAATYLAVTCDKALPAALEPVRDHFGMNGWEG